jgi:hypothetical protein
MRRWQASGRERRRRDQDDDRPADRRPGDLGRAPGRTCRQGARRRLLATQLRVSRRGRWLLLVPGRGGWPLLPPRCAMCSAGCLHVRWQRWALQAVHLPRRGALRAVGRCLRTGVGLHVLARGRQASRMCRELGRCVQAVRRALRTVNRRTGGLTAVARATPSPSSCASRSRRRRPSSRCAAPPGARSSRAWSRARSSPCRPRYPRCR